MRKVSFVKGEYYHIFNRGTDKREIFSDKYDVFRFLQSIEEFNRVETGNDIFLSNRLKKNKKSGRREPTNNKLVNIICYCLNSNHFHLILEEITDGGISEFMKRLGGYVLYYNEKYKRNGALFRGRFKSVHIGTNEQLLYCGVYVNLNNKVHKKFDGTKKHFLDLIPNRSSWNEYIGKSKTNFCNKDIILGESKNINSYKKDAEEILKEIKELRYSDE